MKNFLKVLGLICGVALVAYAAYLCYMKFIYKGCEDELEDDLYDETESTEEEAVGEISFAERIKNAAERQLAKVK